MQYSISASDWFKTFENDVIPGDTQRYFPEITNMVAYTVNIGKESESFYLVLYKS